MTRITKLLFLLAWGLFQPIMYAQKVGIGTSSPANMLSVIGTTDISGNVGIGIASPTKRLDVLNDALIHGLTVGQGNASALNTAFGNGVMAGNTPAGTYNTGMGYSSLAMLISGDNNVALGTNSLKSLTAGNNNTAVGVDALMSLTTGSDNTAVGYNARVSDPTLTNSSAIGAHAIVSTSNSVVLGENVNVGIGTSSPSAKLDVNGTLKTTNLKLTSNAAVGRILRSNASGVGTWTDIATLETDPQVGVLSLNRIPRWNGAQLVNGAMYDDQNKVGINTTSPQFRLDVKSQGAGIRIWSGATGAGNHTSIQIGRTSTEGSLGVAAVANDWASGTQAGDIILRTESSTNKVLLNAGGDEASATVWDGKVGIKTHTPASRLDVEGKMVVGSAYGGTQTAPSNGLLIQGHVGIGALDVNSVMRVATSIPKTSNQPSPIAYIASNDSGENIPFCLEIGHVGGATLNERYVTLQTGDAGGTGNGVLMLQSVGGRVAIGKSTALTALDVEGGIRTSVGGSLVFTIDAGLHDYVLGIATIPSGWTNANSVLMAVIVDGIAGHMRQCELVSNSQVHLKIDAEGTGLTRVNYIVIRR